VLPNGSAILPSSSQVPIDLGHASVILTFWRSFDLFVTFLEPNSVSMSVTLRYLLGMAKCGTSAMYEMLSRFPNASETSPYLFRITFLSVNSDYMNPTVLQ
jgi:hypothetical protein